MKKYENLMDYAIDKEVEDSKESFNRTIQAYSFCNPKGCCIYNLLSDINIAIIELYEVAQNNLFTDVDYYEIASFTPMWMRDAGNSAESALDKKFFEKLYQENQNEKQTDYYIIMI